MSVERVFRAGASVRIQARAAGEKAASPACGVPSRRVHSRYERRLADVAAGGQEVLIHLTVRRFACGNDACERRTFAEQVPGLADLEVWRWLRALVAVATVAICMAMAAVYTGADTTGCHASRGIAMS